MEALYNKYRPQIFEDVVGQEHIERTIKNAIASNKISHAYMFTGPRGTGKTTTARLLSKALLCEKGPTPNPDGTCEECELIAAGEHPDVYELDAASRTGVENVREEIIGRVDYAPTRGKFKVYIIDEVHMLSTPAFNALLKTLEEPPDHVIFIMCTTDPQKVPETILSRCQRFDFRRISSEELVSRLGAICELENIEFEGDALDLIAHRAQGGMRDALTSLEQLIAFGNGEVNLETAERLLGSIDSSDLADIVKAIGTRDAAECFNWTSSYMETGADLVQFVEDLTKHIRDMYVISLAGADIALDVTEAGRRELQVELEWFGTDRLSRMLEVLGDLAKELRTSTNQRLSFEIALTRMVRPESDFTISSLAERIETLERALNGAGGTSIPHQSLQGPKPTTHSDHVGSVSAKTEAPSSASISMTGSSQSQTSEEGSSEAASKEIQADATSNQFRTIGDMDVAQVWKRVLAHLKKIGPAYSVIYMNTEARMDGDLLMIEFSPNNDFAFKAAQKQDAREALEKAFDRAGCPGIKYQVIKSKSDRNTSSKEAPAQEASDQNASGQEASDAKVSGSSFEPAVDAVSVVAGPSDDDAVYANTANDSRFDLPPWEEEAKATVSQDGTESELQDLLTSTFGDGVVFEEVKEE